MSRPFQAILDDVQAAVDACSWCRMQIAALQVQDTHEAQDIRGLYLNHSIAMLL